MVDEAEARVKAYEKSMEIYRLKPRIHQGHRRRSTARSAATT